MMLAQMAMIMIEMNLKNCSWQFVFVFVSLVSFVFYMSENVGPVIRATFNFCRTTSKPLNDNDKL